MTKTDAAWAVIRTAIETIIEEHVKNHHSAAKDSPRKEAKDGGQAKPEQG